MGESVINTFFMMFKADTKGARSEIDAYDKKIEAFRAKGKQRSADETKEMKEAIRLRRELNDQMKESQQTGQRLIESATQAAAAYVSFRAIKSGILDAQKMNRELTIQTDLWGQNASSVAAYANAVKSAGGSGNAAMSWYQGIRDNNASQGLQTMDFDKLMDRVHNQVKGLSQANAQLVFGQYGITDKGQQTLLRKSDSEYEKEIQHQKEIALKTADAGKSSQEFGKAVDDLDNAMTALWTTISSELLPVITPLIRGLTDFVTTMANNKEGAMAFFAVVTTAATGLAANSARLLLGFTGLRGGMLAVVEPLTRFVAVVARLAGLLGFIGVAAYEVGAGAADVVHGTRKSWIGRQASKVAGWIDPDVARKNTAGKSGGGSAMEFWMGQGYTREQAAGIVAGEMAESVGNPNARGDGGRAHGLYQWHNTADSGYRRDAILKGTGIDVSTASADDQRRAAAWEMKHGNTGFNDAYFRSIKSAGDAAAYHTAKFERPGDIYGESVKRARNAMNIAGQTPFSAGSGGTTMNNGQNVSVGTINIQTNSSDPQAIMRAAKEAFADAARETHAQYSDGVEY